MIIRQEPNSSQLFFILKGSVIRTIWPKIILFALLTGVINLIAHNLFAISAVSLAGVSVFGVALSLFLGFQKNAAYERWWEARKLWGAIIADVRAFAIETRIHVPNEEHCDSILRYIILFLYFHATQLEGSWVSEYPQEWCSQEKYQQLASGAEPATISLMKAADRLKAEEGVTDRYGALAMGQTLGRLALAQAGNERIRNTPLPFVYSLLVQRTAYLYCLILPFALLNFPVFYSVLIEATAAYVFFGLQAVTNDLEAPFSDSENAIPLAALHRIAENSILSATNRSVKPPIKPDGYVLA